MGNPALRRNVAEHLGIATAAEIKKGLYPCSEEEVARVNEYLSSCSAAWIETEGEQAALDLEDAFKAEYTPRLTRR